MGDPQRSSFYDLCTNTTQYVLLESGKTVLDDPDFPGIAYRRGASGIPAPVLRGTGIRVHTIVISNREWDETPEEIAVQYDLSEGLVKEALRFYRAHQAEVDLLIQTDSMLELNRNS